MHIPNDLVEVSTSRSRVRDGQANNLLWVDHEDSTDLEKDQSPGSSVIKESHSERKSFCITIGGILGIQHIVQGGNLPVLVRDLNEIISCCVRLGIKLITYNRKLYVGWCDLGTIFINVFDPAVVISKIVG
jgi:hypothetical protein